MKCAVVVAAFAAIGCGSGTIEGTVAPADASADGAEAATCTSEGNACTPDEPCRVGKETCAKGSVFPICAPIGLAPVGTPCDGGKTCDESGACVACATGSACVPPTNPCESGTLDCSRATPTCRDTGIALPEGSSCGAGSVCSANGTCGGCEAGAACTPVVCRGGTIDCSTGSPKCVDGGPLPAGTTCGAPNACDGSGNCVCTPQCGTAMCGDDGCGGSCGTCPGGETCNAGACVVPCSPSNCAAPKACDGDTCSCTAPLPFTIAGCTNVAPGNATSASRTQASSMTSFAADGDRCTAWNSGGAPQQYWQITFPATRSVRGITLVPNMSPSGTVELAIETSPTCLAFTERVLKTQAFASGQTYSFDFGANVSLRCIRVYEITGPSWVAFDEVGVFSCP